MRAFADSIPSRGDGDGAPQASHWLQLDVDEVLRLGQAGWHSGRNLRSLRSAPVVDVRHLMHAGDGAVGGTGLLRQKFALYIFSPIFRQWNAGPAALLRAIMHQPVFADVKVARSGAAAPVIRLAVDDGFLKVIEAGIMLLCQPLHFVINPALFVAQRLQLPIAVMNDADSGSKSQLQRAMRDGQRVLRILDAASHDGVDVDVEIGVRGQHLQLLVQHLKTLLRNLVRLHVVDGNLHVVEPSAIQPLDAVRHQQIAVRNHARHAAMVADARDDRIEFGMQQRFAAGDGNDAGAETRQMVDAAQHLRQWDRVRDLVELIAIGAGEVAATHGHNMRHIGMAGRGQGMADRGQLADSSGGCLRAAGHAAASRWGTRCRTHLIFH